jgi:hypothetical protein
MAGVAGASKDPRVCAHECVRGFKDVLALTLQGGMVSPTVMPQCAADGVPARYGSKWIRAGLCPARQASLLQVLEHCDQNRMFHLHTYQHSLCSFQPD